MMGTVRCVKKLLNSLNNNIYFIYLYFHINLLH